MERAILHSDLNCFYASVEMMLDPSLKGKAVAVCGSTEDRHGIVLAKSELAKKAGVKTGMVNWEARQCCRDLITVPPQYDQYLKYSRMAGLCVSDIMLTEGTLPRKWTPAPNEIYTSEVKIDRRGIEVSNNASSQRTVITNTEFAGYYNDEVIFTLNKDETQTKKTTVDGELTVGKTKFVPMPTATEGLNIVILD